MKLKTNYIRFLMGGRTLEEVAKEAQLSRNWLGTVINRGHANMKTVNKIAKALNVDPIEIIVLDE